MDGSKLVVTCLLDHIHLFRLSRFRRRETRFSGTWVTVDAKIQNRKWKVWPKVEFKYGSCWWEKWGSSVVVLLLIISQVSSSPSAGGEKWMNENENRSEKVFQRGNEGTRECQEKRWFPLLNIWRAAWFLPFGTNTFCPSQIFHHSSSNRMCNKRYCVSYCRTVNLHMNSSAFTQPTTKHFPTKPTAMQTICRLTISIQSFDRNRKHMKKEYQADYIDLDIVFTCNIKEVISWLCGTTKDSFSLRCLSIVLPYGSKCLQHNTQRSLQLSPVTNDYQNLL